MIDPATVEPLLARWAGLFNWSGAQRERVRSDLLAIAAANGGEIAEDAPLPADIAARHVQWRVMGPLDRCVRRFAERLRAERPVRRCRVTSGEAAPGVQRAAWVDVVDVNTASATQLEALPALGSVLAQRILARRNALGRLASVADLDGIEGVGSSVLQQLQERIEFGAWRAAPLQTAELARFFKAPNFETYIALVAHVKGAFAPVLDIPADHIRAIIRQTAIDVAAAPFSTRATRASTILAREARRAAAPAEQPLEADAMAVLLRDRDYAPFVGGLLDRASHTISIALFFMNYIADHVHPTDAIIDQLVNAHTRGVQVRVILDRDRPGDPFHSRIINQAAFDLLQQAGIAVRFDTQDRLMHAKVIVVDNQHTVVGSHNWTAGSFRNYDDTSVYISSVRVCTDWSAWFEALWAESAPN